MKLLPLLLVCLCGCRTDITSNGIPNFAQVEPGVWRGGQPDKAGWAYLRSLGVTNVVKLNTQAEASDGYAESLGMTIYKVPVTFGEQIDIGTIDPHFFDDVLVALPAGGNFFHCEHGQDRTGLFVAMWRVKWDGWTKPVAQSEMLDLGFHKSLVGLWEFWEEWKP